MILFVLLGMPIVGGLLAWVAGRVAAPSARWVALLSTVVYLAVVAMLWTAAPLELPVPGHWIARTDFPWAPSLGIRFTLMADGISMLLLTLTGVIALVAVAASWRSVTRLVGAYYLTLLWTVAGVTGAFVAMDLVLFYFFLELLLLPLYFLIAVWGREKRRYAAIKFLVCTQAGSLALLVGILGLGYAHDQAFGFWSFNYFDLLRTPLSPAMQLWLMIAFFLGFAVKLPVFGLHGWLPDAHAEAPVGGSVLLASLALKVGAYGFLRFLIPLFPESVRQGGLVVMILAVAGILYGGWQSYGQRDFKRLVAYTSLSHMGFVLLGIFSWTELGLQGAMIGILAHGVGTGALFAVAGMVHERTGTYELARMGGLWARLPRLGGATMALAMASLGLPGLANFVGEFLVLAGVWQAHPALAVVASAGLVVSVIYAMKLIQEVFHGPLAPEVGVIPDAGLRELGLLAGCIAILVWMGLCPGPVLRAGEPALRDLRNGGGAVEASPDWERGAP